MWVSHTAAGLPARSRSGNSVNVSPKSVMWAPPVHSCSSGTSDICSGITRQPDHDDEQHLRPGNSIQAKA